MDEELMARALSLAAGVRTHPNPRVAALVVETNGQIVAEAAHAGVGQPHAERLVLDRAGELARGGTLYTTLEPCVHHGMTPPCAEAVVSAGVGRVVIGAVDPDQRVAGRGVAALRDVGIEVTTGVLESEVEAIDPGYFHHRRYGRPRITLKLAATLDGQIAAADSTSQWISSEESRADAHELRASTDAVMVGAGTIIADDPRLTVRLAGYEGPQPRPVIVAGQRDLPAAAKALRNDSILLSPRPIAATDVAVLVVPDREGTGVDLPKAMQLLGEHGLLDVLVEGGGSLATSLLKARLIDRVVVYYGSKLAGGRGRPMFEGAFDTLSDGYPTTIAAVTRLGPDVKVIIEMEDD